MVVRLLRDVMALLCRIRAAPVLGCRTERTEAAPLPQNVLKAAVFASQVCVLQPA